MSEHDLQELIPIIGIAIAVIGATVVYKILHWLWNMVFVAFIFRKLIVISSIVGIIVAIGVFIVTGELDISAGDVVFVLMTMVTLIDYGQ